MNKLTSLAAIITVFIILIILSEAVAAQDYDWLYKVSNAEFYVEISSYFYRGRDVNSISADLTLYPRETYRESIIDQYPDPETKIPYFFVWNNPSDMKLNFSIASRVKTENAIKEIDSKVDFPLEMMPALEEYTHSTETIDSNDPKIIALATSLAAGEDDQYIVVNKLAGWIEENIEYSLDTATEKASKKASWVLENRRGVCDELTNLFLALARSLDMPARFVSGTAYTDSDEFGEGWGPHGWAEIYYPGYGWVPYDITYRQFAWLDLSHITLKESADPAEPSVKYIWAGSDIESGQLDIDVDVLRHSDFEPDRIDLHTSIMNKQAGFGSYNLVEAVVTNKLALYQTVLVHISISETLELIDKNYQIIVLKPGESRTIYWKIRVRPDLDPDYRYTSFIQVNALEDEDKIEFTSIQNDRRYSEAEVGESIENIEESEEKIYSHDVRVSCSIESDAFYIYESREVLCEAENIGKTEHNNLEFCFKEDCTLLDLAINQKYSKRFDFTAQHPGEQDLKFTIKNPEIYNVAIIPVTVYRSPELNIDMIYPDKVEFGDTIVLNFSVSEKTSEVKDVHVKVSLKDKVLHEDTIGELTFQRFILRIPATYLKAGENNFMIDIAYKDYNGKEYKTEESFMISLVNLTFFQKIKLFFMQLLS